MAAEHTGGAVELTSPNPVGAILKTEGFFAGAAKLVPHGELDVEVGDTLALLDEVELGLGRAAEPQTRRVVAPRFGLTDVAVEVRPVCTMHPHLQWTVDK